MATLTISLPENMTLWLAARAAREGGDVGTIVHDAVRREQERCDRIAAMQRHVDEARAGGLSDETMAELRKRAVERGRAATP